MLIIKKGKTCVIPDRPSIGSGVLGRHTMFYDGRTGEYWESMPKLSDSEKLVQKALLNSAIKVRVTMSWNPSSDILVYPPPPNPPLPVRVNHELQT
ncbi:MAG: hypothetical protein V4493_01140 [Pseudomonadota bacterium]